MDIATQLRLSPEDIRLIKEFTLVIILVGAFCAMALSNLGDDKPHNGD